VWQNSTFGHPTNLNAFKEEIGEDLIVVMGYPGVTFDPGIPIDLEATVPMVVYEFCNEPAMQTFEVMKPLLRARGFIN
jgi:hypothetical protein